MKEDADLNAVVVPDDSAGRSQIDYSVSSGVISCFFKELRERLIEQIRGADYVFGCVAWLTDRAILSELAKKRGVLILVQKEDFLRPDTGRNDRLQDASDLRRFYAALPGTWRHDFDGIGARLSDCGDPSTAPVRCVGAHNRTRAAAAPRMHHKFAVFARHLGYRDDTSVGAPPLAPQWQVYAAWTGSFNWSHNASNSFENAILTTEPQIVRAYYDEFQQVMSLSEPLDWQSAWVEPEWRIGS